MQRINVGLIGAGTVGGGVVKLFNTRQQSIEEDLDLSIRLVRIADKVTERFSTLPVGGAQCSSDADDVLNDDSIQIVIELVGGTTFAKDLVLRAIKKGKHVITANKALIAEHGPSIFEAAEKNGVSVYFEAAVGGGMPVIKTIRESLIGNDITSIKTIINGTCNYILTRMSLEGLPFDGVLKQAQELGFAEADPTLDISGGDTGHKVAIMGSLICSGYVPYEAFNIEGITTITKDDIAFANELGYTIKLLGIIKKDPDTNSVDVRVHPTMLHDTHILASVSNEYNAVLLDGDAVGQILLYGKGAGELPTASAVFSDIIDVARNIGGTSNIRISMKSYSHSKLVPLKPIESIQSRYYLRFTVEDQPGVFASIASSLGEEGISIASVIQKEGTSDGGVPVIILTHKSSEKGIRQALTAINKMDYTRNATNVIRIED